MEVYGKTDICSPLFALVSRYSMPAWKYQWWTPRRVSLGLDHMISELVPINNVLKRLHLIKTSRVVCKLPSLQLKLVSTQNNNVYT